MRIFTNPCSFIRSLLSFIRVSSVMYNEVCELLSNTYDIDSLEDNDKDAILARISYVQNHESQLRVEW